MGRIRGKIGRRNIIHVKTEEKAKSRFCASLLRKNYICVWDFLLYFLQHLHISTVHKHHPLKEIFAEKKKGAKNIPSGLNAEEIPRNHWHSSIVHLSSSRILVVGDPEWKMSLAIKSLIQRDSYEEESDITLVSQELITFF